MHSKPLLYAVDDDSTTLMLYEVLFRDEFIVRTFKTPDDFKAYFVGEKPSIVITDLMMPKTDGYQLLDWIRAAEPDMPVIICTAMHGGEHEVAALANNAGLWHKGNDLRALEELARCLTTCNP